MILNQSTKASHMNPLAGSESQRLFPFHMGTCVPLPLVTLSWGRGGEVKHIGLGLMKVSRCMLQLNCSQCFHHRKKLSQIKLYVLITGGPSILSAVLKLYLRYFWISWYTVTLLCLEKWLETALIQINALKDLLVSPRGDRSVSCSRRGPHAKWCLLISIKDWLIIHWPKFLFCVRC